MSKDDRPASSASIPGPSRLGGASSCPPEDPIGPYLTWWLHALEEAVTAPLDPNEAGAIKNVIVFRLFVREALEKNSRHLDHVEIPP